MCAWDMVWCKEHPRTQCGERPGNKFTPIPAAPRIAPTEMLETQLWDLFGSIRGMKAQRDVFMLRLGGIVQAHPTTGDLVNDWNVFRNVLTATRDRMKEQKKQVPKKRREDRWDVRNVIHGFIGSWGRTLEKYINEGWDLDDPVGGLAQLKDHTFKTASEGAPTLQMIQMGLRGCFNLETQFSTYTLYCGVLGGWYYYAMKDYYDQTYKRGGGRGHAGQAAEMTWEQFLKLLSEADI